MNEMAKTLAKWFGAFGDADTLHVYLDGVVVVLGGPADRHLAVRDCLKSMAGGYEEARFNGLSVFLIKTDVGRTRPADLHPLFVATTSHFSDHRDEDVNTIGQAVALSIEAVELIASLTAADDGQHKHGR